jgi:penicillin G amidase
MQSDFHSKLVERMMPQFLPALKMNSGFNEIEKSALGIFSSWDGNLTRESQAASIFEILYRKTLENLIKDDLPKDLYNQLKGSRMILENLILNILPAKTSEWIDDKTTSQIESFDDIVVRSFKETVIELTGLLGENTDNWSWGKIHTFTLQHPLGSVNILDKALNLNKGPFEMSGSFHTVCPYSYPYFNLYKVNHGASHRHVFDLSNWDDSKTVIPTGESGIPASDFYCNQTNLYINNQYHNDPFGFEKVKSAAVFEMKIQPK